MMNQLAGRLQARDWRAYCLRSWEPRLTALLAQVWPMPLRRRATRIVELVGFAGAADATHGRPALFERQEAAVDAAKFWAAAIDSAPWIRIVLHLIGAGGRWGQDTAARRSFL
jgi:hypothetical protein